MKYYFKSYYQPCIYSKGWYGTLDYAPMGIVVELYDDNNCFCICYTENESDYNALILNNTIIGYNTEQEALNDIELFSIEDENVWYGDRLTNRWGDV